MAFLRRMATLADARGSDDTKSNADFLNSMSTG